MPYSSSPLAHVITNHSTSSAINTLGADLLVAFQAETGEFGTPPYPTDSESNTWLRLSRWATGGGTESAIYYVYNPIVSATHTFTPGSDGGFNTEGLVVSAWSGSTVFPVDQQNGLDDANPFPGTTKQLGAVLPIEDNELIISCMAVRQTGAMPLSISAGFVIIDQNTTSRCVAMAAQVQGAATSVNPIWTFSTNDSQASGAVATFKAGGGVAFLSRLALLGAG